LAKKKALNFTPTQKRELIEWNSQEISVSRQCELLLLSKGALYYDPVKMDQYSVSIMEFIDRQYMKTPFFGSRKMSVELRKSGYTVNRKRVQRLMRLMGISAIYPQRSLSQRNKTHKIYPYLLKDVKIDAPNFVWSTDITYIQLREGFLYLVAIIDWYSRYVLSWRVSNTLDVSFCLEALEEALDKGTPVIFNSDQGSQFTSKEFTQILLDRGIKISMDGRGRAFDNIFIERLWRSVKYEDVYLKGYETCEETIDGLGSYFPFYNNQRPHQALGYKVPYEIHYN
jgi:putative transposase